MRKDNFVAALLETRNEDTAAAAAAAAIERGGEVHEVGSLPPF